jgi:chemotaxis protein methyltransferase CheR
MELIKDKEFKLLAELIYDYSGIHLKPEKKTLMTGRLNSMLTELELNSFMDFYKKVKADKNGILLSRLIDRMTTNHTYFMREKEHFDFLRSEVVPYLRQHVKNRDLRVWCAASSSGEEPYTLAMILEDTLGKDLVNWDKKLLATDISLDVLERARKGVYSKESLSGVPKIWLMDYFSSKSGNQYEVKNHIKSQVIYRRFNLLEPVFPFKRKFHVIFCRNVMIYFDNITKETLINKFYNHLEHGGYLFIGHSETIDRSKTRFAYIRPAVYRKI